MAKFVLIVVCISSRQISSALSVYTNTFQAVCAFCSNLTAFTSFPKSVAINIHFQFIFEFISLFNLFGFSFSFSDTHTEASSNLLFQKSKTELIKRAPLSVSSAAEQ